MEEMHTHKKQHIKGNDGGGFVWFLGAIGAAIYYIQTATSFLDGVLGVLKALIWPAILVYHFLQSLGM